MKIVTVIGARPQFIKCASLSREIRKHHQEIIVHTGQHYDYELDRVFFEELDIPKPDYNLEVGSGTHSYQTGEMLKKIEDSLMKEHPDLVLVYGDTNSTLAGALAASKLHIKIGHIEAGLRSFDKSMPEEINRILTDHCADYLFCPTESSVDNLKKERITKGIFFTGDVMVDTLLNNKEIAERSDILQSLDLSSKSYIMVTVHRQSNTDSEKDLKQIVNNLCQINETVVFPLHPRTKRRLEEYGLYGTLGEKVKLIKPLGYLDFMQLMTHARRVVTDSGGVQKEAYILRVPCITLRKTTEWIETVEEGWNILVDINGGELIDAIKNFTPEQEPKNFLGDGTACIKIMRTIGKLNVAADQSQELTKTPV